MYNTKYFDTSYLKKELDLPYTAIEEKIVNQGRWSTYFDIVFQDKDGTYWKTRYGRGSTEMQEERPWEYESEVLCTQVEKRTIQVEQWVPIETMDSSWEMTVSS